MKDPTVSTEEVKTKIAITEHEEQELFIDDDTILADSEHKMKFQLDAFDGPLDLLLFLVRQHKIDIYDIPIAEITDQYLSYLNAMHTYDLDDLTDFYQTAAWLLLIKSRTLLPVHTDIDDEEIDTSRNELINTLIEYQKYKKLSNLLQERYEKFSWLSLRKETNFLPLDIPPKDIWKEVEAVELFSIFMKLMDKPQINQRIIDLSEPVTINEKITLIYEILEHATECKFEDIIAGGGILSVVCSLLAVLELMKQQVIKAMQHVINDEILIVRRFSN